MKGIYKPVEYKEEPSKEELKENFKKFCEVKVATKIDRLTNKYNTQDVFKMLLDENIFWIANNRIACAIETMMKNILVDADYCANYKRDNTNAPMFKEGKYIIYLVELKENLRSCPMRKCNKVMPEMFMDKHIKTHIYMLEMTDIKKELLEKGFTAAQKLNIQPLLYYHDTFKSTACRYCKIGLAGKTLMQQHYHWTICDQNPQPKFMCPNNECGKRLDSLARLESHMRDHVQKEKFMNRNFEFKCKYCNFSSKMKSNRKIHEKTCKSNPNPEYYNCRKCDKKLTSKRGRNLHELKCSK